MIENFIDHRGVVLRRDVVAAGIDDIVITRAVRDGFLVRIRHGACCRRDIWAAGDRVEQHRLRSHAARRQYSDDVTRSHASALLEMGGPDWGIELDTVHLTNLYGIGERTQAGIAHHRGAIHVGDVRRHDGSWLTTPARTALDTAATAPREPAVCVLNWVQQTGRATRAELAAGVERMSEWPGTLGLGVKLGLSTGLAESVGEVRLDLLCRDHHLPRFVPQYEIHHPSGELAGRVDGAWPEYGVMIEFDGLTKYHAFRRPGETIEQCVIREKAREDLLRRLTGWTMIRLTWADLERPEATARMIRQLLRTAAA